MNNRPQTATESLVQSMLILVAMTIFTIILVINMGQVRTEIITHQCTEAAK